MANRYSVASGLASAVGTWDGGVAVPVSGDRVMISAGHTVTLDGNYEWGDDLGTTVIVINGVSTDRSIWVAGTLKASRAVNSQLTCLGTLDVQGSGGLDYGKNADPIPTGVSAKILLNKSAVMTTAKYGLDVADGGAFHFYGEVKKRITTLNGATLAAATIINVVEATGWKIGDRIVLPNDSGTGTDQTEIRTIAGSYTPGATSVPLTAALTYAHTNGLPVGNLESNVYVAPVNINQPSWAVVYDNMTAGGQYREIRHASFESLHGYPGNGNGKQVGQAGFQAGLVLCSNITATLNPYISIGDIASFATLNNGQASSTVFAVVRRNYNVLPTVSRSVFVCPSTAVSDLGGVNHDACLIGGTTVLYGVGAAHGGEVNDCWLSGRAPGWPIYWPANDHGRRFNRTKFFGTGYACIFGDTYGGIECVECDFGFTFPLTSSPAFRPRSTPLVSQVVARDCKFGANVPVVNTEWYGALHPDNYARVVNKNQDPLVQEEYLTAGDLVRDNAVNYSGTNPSWRFSPRSATVPLKKKLQVLAPYSGANPTLTVVSGRIKRDAGIGAASVTLKGLGIVPSVYNCTGAAGVWEQFIVFATQLQGSSGVLEAEISALYSSGTLPKMYVAEVSAPLAIAANTGSFQFWADGQPVQLIMANAVGAVDVMNVLLAQLTLPDSVGKAIAEMFRLQGLELGTPLEVTKDERTAGALITQQISSVGGTVTVARQ